MPNNRFDFDNIAKLRDRLIEVLAQKASPDGLYRSSITPNPTASLTPSFTNSGMVLQAFIESGQTHHAHSLADKLIDYVVNRPSKLFPNEKVLGQTDVYAHVICNSWATFSILDCYPLRALEIKSVCDWLLKSQRHDGSWAFIEVDGATSSEPIVTAYAISSLQQYHNCYRLLYDVGRLSKTDMGAYIAQIDASIDRAIDFLMKARAETIREKGLYLWPATTNPGATDQVSLGASTMCMHVLAKWERYKGLNDRMDAIAETFGQIASGERLDNRIFIEALGQDFVLWDEIHFNDSPINAQWYFFAPISIVPIIRFIKHPKFRDTEAIIDFVKLLVAWIEGNVARHKGNIIGIMGSPTLREPKTWSAAQAAIVLSRVLASKHILEEREQIQNKYNSSKQRLIIENAISYYKKPLSLWAHQLLTIILLLALIVSGFFLFEKYFRPERWPRIEGWWTLTLAGLSIFISLMGWKIEPIRRVLFNITNGIIQVIRIPGTVKRLSELETANSESLTNRS